MGIKDIAESIQKELIKELDKQELNVGEIIYNNGNCQVLSQSGNKFEFLVNDQSLTEAQTYVLEFDEENKIIPSFNKNEHDWNRYSYSCLLQLIDELHLLDPKEHVEHKKYSRQGMINRVLKERIQKAEKAEYVIKWADNIYGDHTLTNENGVKYKVFLRDFENETGYSNSADSQLNKLGTTKHIMFAFSKIKGNKSMFRRLKKTYPFIEIFCDPLNEYKITLHHPEEMKVEEQVLISRYFKNKQFIEDDEIEGFLEFIEEAESFDSIVIRPEVKEKIERAFEQKLLSQLAESYKPDYAHIKATLFDYQKEGIEFVLFRKAAIIADEMGLGKTMQAISAAIQKKNIFGFTKTLIVCPASLKSQWKSEIEKFSDEKAIVVEGNPIQREEIYGNTGHYFFILNYETILRDSRAINKAGFDFLILDEAQRVKNFETKTASAVKRLNAKHVLVITGTPIENKLIDIYSIMSILNPHFFGPLWEFSYQHCLFDPDKQNKINGYYDLQKLNKKLEEVLIRREKRKVLDQLPNLRQINIPINLSPLQAEYHASFARGIAKIIRKKFLTPYDLQRLMLLLANMRMVCDSTYLIDDETNESPKLDELKYILLEKLDIANQDAKIIIFSEWIKVHKLIGKMLRENNIGFVELNGKVPVKMRGDLIKKFESNPASKVFLSTEAGGSGLNLQVADTLINFELPWNPAKKNQRIGRIDRLGQKSNKLTIYNLITRQSIEQQIAAGLLIKQNLFEGVLNSSSSTDFVDFSRKGRSQFIDQLEEFIEATEMEEPVIEIEQELLKVDDLKKPEEEQQLLIDFSEDEKTEDVDQESVSEPEKPVDKTQELEQVMNSGMQFLSGLFKMSTGKEMGMEDQKISIDKETGEVTMKFKLPI